jgi:hypothetical protein
MKFSRGNVLLGVGITAGIAAIVAGVMVAGTPAEGRMQRLDRVRAGDLRAIATSIDAFWQRQERLPDSLGELVADPRAQVSVDDPDTEQEYEYRILGEDSYELCAVFALASIPNNRAPDAFWLHSAGRHCFSLVASAGGPLERDPAE